MGAYYKPKCWWEEDIKIFGRGREEGGLIVVKK